MQPALRRLGDFTVISELGRGGMGVVYRAKQESMGRIVALKVLPSFAGMDKDAVQRFRREAEAAGRLSHPGIVPIYAVGEAEGVHYFAMEMVDGPSLQGLLDSLKGRVPGRLLGSLAEESGLAEVDPTTRGETAAQMLSGSGSRYARSCAALCADVANALSAAHANKIIHRDLKPSNVLIRKGGKPVLVDFGLSRDEMAVGLTQSGEAVGTPSYMSPEQARGSKQIDARVDIYGLGATLFEMLALRPPFEGAHSGEIMRKILDEDPPQLRRLNERVPPELETIVEACLQKDPDKRYPAAEALEHDLRAFLRGEAVTATRGGAWSWLRSSLRRHRKAVSVASLALVASAATLTTVGIVMSRSAKERGFAALDAARSALLEQHDLAAAREAYGRAVALLGDPGAVDRAQRDHLRAAFESLYRVGRLDLLGQIVADYAKERHDAEIAAMERRLAGVGTLKLAVACESAQVAVRGAKSGLLAPEWTALPADGEVPVGEYLVLVQRPGFADEVHRVLVERDKVVAVQLLDKLAGAAGVDLMLVPGDARLPTVWAARTELSCGEYAQALERCDSPDLRNELMPKITLDRSRDLPVRGLTLRQAKLAAALLGGHLPTLAEHRKAASGGIDGLLHPWGAPYSKDRVVADPDAKNEPEPTTAALSGASPLGILNLVGNVAEFLAPERQGRAQLAGGYWQSDVKDLTIAAPPYEVGRSDEAPSFAGMRLWKFAVPAEDLAAKGAAQTRLEQVTRSGRAFVVGVWDVGSEGTSTLSLAVAGNHLSDSGELVLPLVTEGFLHRGAPVATTGQGENLTVTVRKLPGGMGSELRLQTTGRRGERYVARVVQSLTPVEGLREDGPGYVLELPTQASSEFPVLHEVVLPRGAVVESSEPDPSHQWVEGARVHMLFEHATERAGVRTMPICVRFRRDGMLTKRWPALAVLTRSATQVFAALGSRSENDLRAHLSADWMQLPSELDREGLLSIGSRSPAGERFSGFRIVDASVVGDVATVALEAGYTATDRDGQEIAVPKCDLRLALLREGDRWVGLRLAPASCADSGTWKLGSYQHSQLKVEWSPPVGGRLVRRIAHPCEMQVACQLEDGSAHVLLLGEFSEPEAEDMQIKLRLSAGESRLRPGSRETGPDFEFLGRDDGKKQGTCEDWLFGRAGRGIWSRERWIFVRAGRRSILVKLVANGATPMAARAAFERNQGAFQSALTALEIR